MAMLADFKMTNSFNENVKEVIVLSDIIYKEDFREVFVKQYIMKVKNFKECYSSEVDVKILQRLQCKLFEPLKFHLKNVKNSDSKRLLIEGLIQVLKITPLHDVGEFFDLYALVFFQIFKGANTGHQQPEELKMSVLEFCSLLIDSSTLNLLGKIYTEEHGAKFSLGISIAVNIVKEERSIKLRVAALDFLLAASRFSNNLKYNMEIYKKVGDLFALYLPGIIAPLLEVVLRDETQHHLITVKSLTCWGHVICLVMSDLPSMENLSENEIIKEWLETPRQQTEEIIDINKVLKEEKRTKKWTEAAAIAIQPLILKVSEVRKHSNAKVRLELTRVMVKLLKNCTGNLKKCLSPIIEVLVSSGVDDEGEVREVAERALSEFEGDCGRKNVNVFVSVIEENLYSLVIKLPTTVRSGNEKLTLPALKSLSGYLKILARLNRLRSLISLSSTLKKLVTVIQISFELEMYPELSNQEFSIWDVEPNSRRWSKPWKRFRHFADKSTQTQLQDICRVLGESGQPEPLFDFLLDTYNEEHSARKELLLIINEIVAGAKEIPDHVVRELVDFYLDPKNLYLALKVDEVDCPTVKEAQSNIIKVALVMEGLGKLARNLGKRFEDYLLRTLYYLLEGMGSSYAVIREAATGSGVEVANACGLDGNIASLIEKNVDYLTYHITIKLKRNDPGVFNVVNVMMKNSPLETMPNLEEIINSVLRSSSRNVDSPHTISYLRLFQTFVLCVNKWMGTRDRKPPQPEKCEKTEVDEFVKCLKSEPEEEEREDGGDEEEVLEPPKPPRHLQLTVSVSNHCLHYLASKDKDRKLVVLEILNEAVWILSDWENELLPLVHKIWSPLVTRFDTINDPLLINRSFALLCSLSHTSRSFIRSRTLKNVLPTLQSFLVREAPKSRLKNSSSGYFFTQSFKLQRELLENLGKLASSLGLFEKQTDLVIESGLPYLSSYQPRELQEKSRRFMEDLNVYDPYLVWFKLRDLVDDPEYGANARSVLKETGVTSVTSTPA